MILLYGQIKGGVIIPNNPKEVMEYEGKEVAIRMDKKTGVRTENQNSAIHKYFELLADAFNDAGYTVQKVLAMVFELRWTKNLIKELLWRPIQIALTGKKSTTELDKVEDINLIYDHININIGEKMYIHVPFPHDPDKNKPAVTVENYPVNELGESKF